MFVAPTKPLLNQQVTACYQKMSISKVGAAFHDTLRSSRQQQPSRAGSVRARSTQQGPDDERIALPPQEHIEELTGSTNAERRAELWATPHKRMFFMTPQTFKNDVFKGS